MQTVMKKIFMILAAALLTVSMSAADLTGKRIYVNPGHGSWGPNDRPMATIPYPKLATTGMPDTLGFYESNTNLWKCMYLGEKLEAAGATVLYSRTQSGPWPYEMKNGDYPDYVWCKNCGIADQTIGWQVTDSYDAHPDYEKYNRILSEICEEVEANNIDFFISVHSNANTEGSTANFPLFLYRGPDAYSTANSTDGYEYVVGSYEKCKVANEEKLKIMEAGIDVASSTAINVRGDWNFYGSHKDQELSNGKKYNGYLGALKHGASGYLSEGYFHTYQPARHRALNQDYCHMEGLDYYRGVINHYGADKETTGYIVGTVKDQHNKMNNSLYQYVPKTNDEWVPCNGAEVILKKAGVEVARYTVDNNYNGIFVFEGLEPGDDYTLEASCDGYYPLDQTKGSMTCYMADKKAQMPLGYRESFSVKANATTYPMILLADTSWTPPAVVYTNYPNPEQPAYLGVPSVFEMEQAYVDKDMDALFADKTIRRVLYRDGMMYVLAIDAAKNPTLAVVNEYGVVEAELPTDFCTYVGAEGMKLSDIAFTADGVLVGCNKEAVSFNPSNKWNLYKWEKTAEGWTGALWQAHANNETAGNYNNAYVGGTFAYSGTLAEGTIAATTVTTGSSKAVRYTIYSISDTVVVGAIRNQPDGVTEGTYGVDMKLVVSPRDSMSFVLSSSIKQAVEWQIVNTTKSAPTIVGTMPFITHTPNYFKYAGKAMMVAPVQDADGKNIGVAVYDITAGVDKAQLIKTTKTTLDPSEAAYTAAFAQVKDADLTLYLVADDAISKFTTANVAQPVVPAIMAHDLNVTLVNGIYTFSYNANSDAKAAALVFYKDGIEAGRVVVDVKKGANTYELAAELLPGEEGDTFTWALDLTGEAIANFGIIAEDLSLDESSTSRLFNAVNTNPENEAFGKIFVMHRAGSSSSAAGVNSGIWVYDYDLVKQNSEVYKGGLTRFGNPTRMSMDRDGYLYIADWADGYSGIYLANTADMTQPFTQFFAGTRQSSGAISNNGVYTGSSTPGCNVYHNGNEVKLFVYNEDAAGTLPANGMVVYNIGQEDGTILRQWETAPSAVYTLTGQGNTEGNPWGTSHGFFVSQVRTEGQNSAGYTSLKFYDYEGNEQMSSAADEYKEIITGSDAGGYVVSADESLMVFNGGSKEFLVFDIAWEGNKPVMTLKYTINHGIASIRQMNWDYAGNIVCSGDNGVQIVTLPKEVNNTIVPAKKALTLVKKQGVAVAGIELSVDSASVELDATIDLSGLVVFTPADATNKMVTWKSEDETIATVDANGVVTGLKLGTTKISATSMEGNYSDTLNLTVIPVAVKGIKILSGDEDGIMRIGLGAPYAIAYEITPANAANKNLTWESSNPEVAAVQNNQALIIGVADGVAIITVTTEDGGYQDFLTVYAGTYTSVEDVKNATGLDLNAPMYDVVGRQVDASYRGVIIQNGNKYLLK